MTRIQLSFAGSALLVLASISACTSAHGTAAAPSDPASATAQSPAPVSTAGSQSEAAIPSNLSFVFDTGAYLAGHITIVDHGKIVPLKVPYANAFLPSPNHAGTKIAFSAGNSGPDSVSIVIANRDGSNLRVVPGTVGCFAGTWFPDDSRLVINCGLGTSPPWHVRVTSVAGVVVGSGFDNPLPGSQPFLSADGSSLAFADGANIYVTDLFGRVTRTIAGAQGLEGFVAWSPDGKHLLFTSATGADTQLLTVSPSGGTPTPILSSFDPLGHASFAVYSPDGSQILLSGGGDQTDDIRIVNADGSGLYTVAGAGEGSDAVWLP